MRNIILSILALTASMHAATIYNFNWDTSLLPPTNANYVLDIVLTGTAGNQISIAGINYGPGGSGPSGAVNLDTSTNFFNESLLTFTPGGSLSFQLTTTTLASGTPGGFSDELTIYLLDTGLNALPTTDTFASALLVFDLNPTLVQTFAGTGGLLFPAPNFALFTPGNPGPGPATVPEPSSFGLLGGGFLALWCLSRR